MVKDENKRAEKEEKLRLLEEKKMQEETEQQKVPYATEEQIKEKKPEAGTKEKIIKNLAGRSKDFGKCFNLLESARKEIGANKNRAKELYAKAREVYVGLDYHEKKEIYSELMELYNELLK